MSEKQTEKSETFSEASMPSVGAISVRREMRDHIADVMRWLGGDSRKDQLRKAAQVLGVRPGRVADLYYEEARRVDAEEADLIRGRAQVLRAKFERLEREYEAARRELVATAPRGLGWLVPPALPPADEVAPPLTRRGAR